VILKKKKQHERKLSQVEVV